MIGVYLLICWILMAPVMDGLIFPELIYNRFVGGLPVWAYLVYFGAGVIVSLFAYYLHGVVKDD